MEKIRNLPTRIDKKGKSESWAVFFCDFCKSEVERPVSNGYKQKSCGCQKIKHGESKTRLYNVWNNMKNRCLNTKVNAYKDYGGRGITICPEWAESYVVFRDWALSNGYSEGLQINRIENDGNYEPSNCNFVTGKENNRNQRNTITIEMANEIRELDKIGEYTRKELSIKYNISQVMISYIINNKNWKN